MSYIIGDLLFALVPKKYRGIGHMLVGLGMFIIILSMFFMMDLYNILGQNCLVVGLLGIYFRKRKNFGSGKKPKETEGIEQESLDGVDVKFLIQKYIFLVITIVGIIFMTIFYLRIILQSWDFLYVFRGMLAMIMLGDLLLVGGLLILNFKKSGEKWSAPKETPRKRI